MDTISTARPAAKLSWFYGDRKLMLVGNKIGAVDVWLEKYTVVPGQVISAECRLTWEHGGRGTLVRLYFDSERHALEAYQQIQTALAALVLMGEPLPDDPNKLELHHV